MADQVDRTVLPIRRGEFTGTAGRTLGESTPDWNLIGHAEPPAGAPNVLLVLIDDAGFGNPSTFGGPIRTPNYDRMAAEGLRYNRFHVTAMCSPTRAALLTGRNHHAVGMGGIPEFSCEFPGYAAMLPRDAAPFSKVLKENGYSTACVGKWHLTPEGEQGPAGPFSHWPNAWGFDYFWGFLAPEKPWMLYYSTGCSHAPHHVAKEWSDRYKGGFDQGWDQLREETFARQKALGVVPEGAELTPRDDAMPAWDSLSENSKRLFAHQMEVYAGYSENADHQVGRLLEAIEEMGELENTVVVWIWGDNGASLEGTPTGSFNEGTMVNGLPLTDEEQMQLALKWGGLEAWVTEMMYAARRQAGCRCRARARTVRAAAADLRSHRCSRRWTSRHVHPAPHREWAWRQARRSAAAGLCGHRGDLRPLELPAGQQHDGQCRALLGGRGRQWRPQRAQGCSRRGAGRDGGVTRVKPRGAQVRAPLPAAPAERHEG